MMAGEAPSPYDEYGYIKNGKIFHLDGIDIGEVANSWVDIVNNVVYANVSATRLTDGWSFSSSKMTSAPNYFPASSNYTVETVIKPTSTAKQVIWTNVANSAGGANTPCLLVSGDGRFAFLQNNAAYNLSITTGNAYCISLNTSVGLINGEDAEKSGTNYDLNNTSATAFIGTRNNGKLYYKGSIHSIRVYNRKLSISEMLNNQQVDNQRFNLGLSI